jgi:MoaA/NifB/PqqE/SkfB family radical SAM enzyme
MTARYSTLKALRFPDRLAGIASGTATAPVHVQIILSDLCNQACHFCAYRDPSYTSSVLFHIDGNYNPKRFLPFEKLIEVLDDCVAMGVRAIQYTGGGEPTVYPRFQEAIDATVARGLKWSLVTNGVLSRNRDFSTATWIRVSLDAANAATYSRIRSVPQDHFAKACQTIKRYGCGVGFVVTPENWGEIVSATELARSIGASNIRIGAQFSSENAALFDGFRAQASALAKEAESLAEPGFEVVNRFDEKLAELDDGNPEYDRCGFQYFTTYIGADQNLYRCCVYAYNPHGLIGSIRDRRFRDVWPEAHAAFRSFSARGCERCQFQSINRAINDVLTPDPSEAFV